ncbi:MAG: hypothetical protein AAF335_02405, partial [Bacteroidota bacterium]
MNKIQLMTGFLLATSIPNLQGTQAANGFIEMWFFPNEKSSDYTFSLDPAPTNFLKILISTKSDISGLLQALGIDEKQDTETITRRL